MKNSALILILLLAGCTQFIANVTGLDYLHDRRSREVILQDSIIEAAVNEIDLLKNKQSELRVQVLVYKGRVLVAGEASTLEQRDKVIANIRIIKGIKVIYNEMNVAEVANSDMRKQDRLLEQKITASLLVLKGYPEFDETRVKVLVADEHVYLMGLLYKGEAKSAAEKIQKIEEIRKIITLFEYIENEKI